jgi:hypothetical protein
MVNPTQWTLEQLPQILCPKTQKVHPNKNKKKVEFFISRKKVEIKSVGNLLVGTGVLGLGGWA